MFPTVPYAKANLIIIKGLIIKQCLDDSIHYWSEFHERTLFCFTRVRLGQCMYVFIYVFIGFLRMDGSRPQFQIAGKIIPAE